jgi:colanic acid/amylovoran biosynthesis glycosyltransferase
MRIAYFTNQYPAPSHTFIKREIVALEALGHVLHRYAIRHSVTPLVDPSDIQEHEKTRHITRLGIPGLVRHILSTVVRHPRGILRGISHAWKYGTAGGKTYGMHFAYLLEAAILADWCHKDGIEHLHVHFGTNPATIAALAHQISGIKFSFTVHGADEFDRPIGWSLGRKISSAAFTVGVSSWGRAQLMRWAAPDDWGKIQVVHCGIDDRYVTDEPEGISTAKRLLCVARLSTEKGHIVLLEASRMLRDQGYDFQLVLAGDGPLRKRLEQETARLGLTDIVSFLGTVSQEEVRKEILKARAFVLPSYAEGLPVVLMETMALKRPAIATYVAGIPELVRSDNGWIVHAGDPLALSKVMAQALSADGEELLAKGEAGRRRVLERHDIAVSAAKLDKLMTS